ncbi:MAG: peptidoglycan-binding domain-containing protein [Candidatus Binatia bacterium]
MKQFKKWLSSLSLVMGALAFTALPVWAQAGSPQGDRPSGGSSASQGQSGAGETERKGAPLRDERTQTGAMGQGQSGGEPGASGMSRSGPTAGNEEVKKIQQALKEKGQDPGPIDGVMGPKTKEALKAFQQQQGLKVTGSLDEQTKKALGIEGGSASSGRSSSAKSDKMGAGTGPSTDGRDSARGGEERKPQ